MNSFVKELQSEIIVPTSNIPNNKFPNNKFSYEMRINCCS